MPTSPGCWESQISTQMCQEHWVGQYRRCGGSQHHSLSCSSRLSPPSLFSFFFLIFWPHNTACGILVPRPGIKPACPALEAQSLNHWTTRKVLEKKMLLRKYWRVFAIVFLFTTVIIQHLSDTPYIRQIIYLPLKKQSFTRKERWISKMQ